MNQIEVPSLPSVRVEAFLFDYFEAPDDADIEVRLADIQGSNEPALVIGVAGKFHGFTASEARILADIFEDSLRKFPDTDEAKALPNIIMCLRYAAEQAENQMSPNRTNEEGNG